jgi:uncharacterized membrane protein required for colicin V production
MSDKIPVNWFDFVVFIVLAIGLTAGRKRGMSQIWLDMFKWLAMAFGAAFAYPHITGYLTQYLQLGLGGSRVLAYLIIALAVFVVFGLLKDALRDKLAGSDFFGRLEYPLGILAGMVQAACVLVMILALLHSHQVTNADREAAAKAKKEGDASGFFPAFCEIHDGIFLESMSGRFVKDNLNMLLLPVTPAGAGSAEKSEKLKDRKQRELDELMKGR